VHTFEQLYLTRYIEMEQQTTQLSIYNVTIKHGHSYVLTKSIFVVLQIVDYENLGSVI
jgi:hypothetical protein